MAQDAHVIETDLKPNAKTTVVPPKRTFFPTRELHETTKDTRVGFLKLRNFSSSIHIGGVGKYHRIEHLLTIF